MKGFFDLSDGTYGSPRILEDLRDDGWTVSKKTVEASIRRQGLVARPSKKKGAIEATQQSKGYLADHGRQATEVEYLPGRG